MRSKRLSSRRLRRFRLLQVIASHTERPGLPHPRGGASVLSCLLPARPSNILSHRLVTSMLICWLGIAGTSMEQQYCTYRDLFMLSVLALCSTAAWLMACCDIASRAFMMDRLHLFACCTTPHADLFLCPTDSQAPREESWLRPAAARILLRLPCQSDS